MKMNVDIRHFRRGCLIEERHVHNTWVYNGRVYLAEIVGAFDWPPTTLADRKDRLKYVGLGIGGVGQHPMVASAPFPGRYSPGSDPLSTTGDQYRHDWPETNPGVLSTLEMPVRVTGGETDYPGAGSDVWLLQPPAADDQVWFTHQTLQELTVHAEVDCSAGEYIYGSFTQMPISEAGLFTDTADVNTPYNPVVAYLTFDTIILDADSFVEFIWHVRFVP